MNPQKISKKKILSTFTASAILSACLIPGERIVHAEEEAIQKEEVQKKQSDSLENRVFNVDGKGNVHTLGHQERREFPFSPYEPTGLYAKPDEEITIQVKGNQNIKAYIGTYSYVGDSGENELVESFTLKPGINTINYSGGGMIYLSNEQENGRIQAIIEKGGSPVPYFELGKHTKEDLITMLEKHPNAYAVELKGERVLITATPARIRKYLLGSNTDPVQLLKTMDAVTRVQDKISGLSEEQVDKHYIHYVEDNRPDGGYMYATGYRTAYVGDAIQAVLDLNKFITEGWGAWHEAGHMRQQEPWMTENMQEVQVNIFSLAVQKALGQPSRLETENVYTAAFRYLKQDAKNKDYDKIKDPFVKLVMLWQLHLAYGDNFYPTLHQHYRDMPDEKLPKTDEDKKQLFMIEASKAAKQNLIPFFEQWGLKPNQNTIQKIIRLGYPIFVDPIWMSTDSKPIKPESIHERWIQWNSNQTWSYFNEDWSIATGWKEISEKKYYFGQTNDKTGLAEGEMATGWKKIAGTTYYFSQKGDGTGLSEGEMATDWFKVGADWYRADNAGILNTGILDWESDKYFFDKVTGKSLFSIRKSGNTYYGYGPGGDDAKLLQGIQHWADKTYYFGQKDDGTGLSEGEMASEFKVLEITKEEAKRHIDSLSSLTMKEKNQFKNDLNSASDMLQVYYIWEKADAKHAENTAKESGTTKEEAKHHIDSLPSLTMKEKEELKKNVDSETDTQIVTGIRDKAETKGTYNTDPLKFNDIPENHRSTKAVYGDLKPADGTLKVKDGKLELLPKTGGQEVWSGSLFGGVLALISGLFLIKRKRKES